MRACLRAALPLKMSETLTLPDFSRNRAAYYFPVSIQVEDWWHLRRKARYTDWLGNLSLHKDPARGFTGKLCAAKFGRT
jgi:hypothetical protein